MKRQRKTLAATALLVLLGVLVVMQLARRETLAQGGGYDLSWWTVDSGGGTLSARSYALAGTAGQPDAGPALSGGSYALVGGFGPGVQPAQTPLILSGLPDQVFDQDSPPPGTIDLWDHTTVGGAPYEDLVYAIPDPPPSGAGVTLGGNRFVNVDPSTDWCGYVDVTVRVTDPGGPWDEDTFRVAVTWSCQGPLPVADQAAAQDEPMTLDLTTYEPQIGDGTGMVWYVTGTDHCTVSGEYSEGDVLTFTPRAGYQGSDAVTLHMTYPWGSEATQALTLTWGGTEAPPGRKLYLPLVGWNGS